MAENPTLEEYLTLRKRYSAARNTAVEWLEECDRNEAALKPTLLHPLDDLKMQIAGLTESAIGAKEVLQKMQTLLEKISNETLIAGPISLDTLDEKAKAFLESVSDRVKPPPLDAPPPMPDLPTNPIRNRAGKMLGINYQLGVSAEVRTSIREAFEGTRLTLATFQTPQGFFVVDQMELFERFSPWMGEYNKPNPTLTLKLIDILGRRFILERDGYIFRSALVVPLDSQSAYGRMLHNYGHLTAEGGAQVVAVVNNIFRSGPSPKGTLLDQELSQLLAAFDPEKEVNVLESAVLTWAQSRWDMAVNIPQLKFFADLFPPTDPVQNPRKLTVAEADHIAQQMLAGVVLFEEMGLPVGEISPERWSSLLKRHTLVTEKVTDVSIRIAGLVADCRPQLGKLFEHLENRSPQLLQQILRYIPLQLGDALAEREKGETIDLAVVIYSAAAACRQFEAEIIYSDIWKHYRPYDWSQQYFDAGAFLYKELPKTPDHWGLRIVGWQRFKGKAFAVSESARNVILSGAKDPVGVTSFEAIDLETGETITVTPPEKITTDQFRWTEPYAQQIPNIWETLSQIYADPSMMVVAKIYEEAIYLARGRISPYPFLARQVYAHLFALKDPSLFKEIGIPDVRARLIEVYRRYAAKADKLELGDKAPLSAARESIDKIIPQPAPDADAEALQNYISRRQTLLNQYFFLGYDRRLDEAYEKLYTVVIASIAAQSRESILRNWLAFLEDAIRMQDVGGMLKEDEAKANSYARRYLKVVQLLETHLEEEGRTEEVEELRERVRSFVLSKLSFLEFESAKSMFKWIMAKPRVVPPSPLMPLKESVEALQLDEGYAAYLKSVLDDGVAAVLKDVSIKDVRTKAERILKINFKQNLRPLAGQLVHEMMTLRRANPQLSYSAVMTRILAKRYPGSEAFGAANQIIPTAIQTGLLHTPIPEVLEAQIAADFPDMCQGKLVYTEAAPETRDEELPEQGGVTSDQRLVTSGRGEGNLDAVLAGKAVPPKLAEHFDTLLLAAMAWYRLPLQEENIADMSRDKFYDTLPSYHDYIFEALSQISPAHHSEPLDYIYKIILEISGETLLEKFPPKSEKEMNIATRFYLELLKIYERFGHEFQFLEKFHPTEKFSLHYASLKKFKERDAEQKYSPEWVQAWWKMEKLFLQPLLDRIATDCKKEVDRLGVPYKNYVDFLMAEAKKAGLKERVYERLLVRRNFHLTYSNLPRVLGDGFAAFDEQSGDIHNGRKAQELDEARIRLIKHLAQKVSADKKAPHKEFLLQEFPELGWITPSPLVGEGRGEGSDYDAILTEAAKKVMALDDASGFVSKKPVGAELFIRMISENIEPSFEALRKIPPTHQSKAFQHTITGMSNMAEIFVQRLKTFSPAQKKNGEQFILKFLWACDKFGYEPDAAKLGPFKEWFEELKKGKAATSDAQREASANRLQELLETAGMIEHYGNGVIHENYLPFARDEEIKLGLSPKKMLGAKFHHHEGVIRRMNPYLPTMTARVTSYKLAKHNTRFAVTFKEYNDRIEEVYPLLLNHFKNGISQANQKKFAADLAIDFPELVWSKLISSPFLEEVAPDYDAILGSALEKVKDLALSAQHLKDEDLLMKNVLLTVDILFEALQKIPPSHQSTMREKVLDMLDTFAKTLAMKEGDKNRLNQFSLRLLWAYDRFGFEFDALNAGPLAGVYNDLKKAKASQPFSKEYENHLSDMVEKLHAMQLGIDEDLPSNKPFLNFIGRFAKNLFDAKDLRGGSVDTLVQLVGSVVGEGKMRAFMNYWPDTLCRWISLLNITAFEKMTPPVKREIVESYMFMRNALLRKIIADATADERAQFEKELDFCFPELVWADVFATNSGIIPSPLEGEGVRRTGEGSYDHLLDALATQLMPMSTDMKKHMSRGGSNDDFYRWMKDVDLYFDCFKQIPAGYRSAKLNEVMFESLDHFGYMLADGYSEYSNTRRKEINRFFLKLLWACDRFSMELEELPAQKKKWPLARAYAAWVVMKNEERFSSKWMERANFFAEELAKSGMLPFLFMQNGGWATNVEPLGDGAPTKKEDFAGYIRWLHSKVAEGSPSGDFLLKSSPSRVFRRAEPFVPESFLEFLHARKIGPQNVPAYRAWRSAFVADLQRGMSDEEIFTYQHDLTIDFPEWKEKMDQGLVTSDRGEGTLETRPQDKRLLDAQGVSIARLRKLESDGTPPQSGVMGKILALRRETPPDVVKIWGALEPAFQALWAIDPKYHSIQQEEALHLIDQQAQKILKHYERYEGDAKKAANELILRLLWAYDKFGYNFESAKAAPVREFFAHAKQVKGAVPHLKRWYEHCNSFENILGKAGIILEAGHAVDKGRIDPKDLFEWINRMVKRLSLTPISVERMVAFGAIASSQNYYPLSLLSFSPAWLLTFEGLEEREPTYEIGHARWQEADQAREAILKCLREDGLPNLSKEAMQYLAFVFPELVWEGKLEATFLDGGR
ncbi:MAG: hypothetical protein Q7T03_07260 [Deltaproteobacteria bacterium]|nr:hypothetical protein [Deltaproteobacteria bacterium]